jgi:hypothetical protein
MFRVDGHCKARPPSAPALSHTVSDDGHQSLVSMNCASKDSTGADLALAPVFLALAHASAPRREVSGRSFVTPL